MKRICYVLFASFIGLSSVLAQDSMNKPPIEEKYKMFSKSMTRRADLQIKQNRPFYSKNAKLPEILLEAYNNGHLKIYNSDSCLVEMPDSVLQNRINYVTSEEVREDPNDQFNQNMVLKEIKKAWKGDEFTAAYIKEDVIFDRNRSRMYWYIKTISIAIPVSAQNQTRGIASEYQNQLHFKYDELVEVLRDENLPYKEKALWYNDQNLSAHRNMTDAFELRLFSAPIIKVSNNEDLDIRRKYAVEIAADPMKALIIQQKLEHDLAEYEAELWSY